MFIGEYMQNVDAKGRVNIPAKFRADLGQTFVVAKGSNCIAVYPVDEWGKFLENVRSESMQLLRFFSAGSSECELDTQGRVVIPPNIREYIGLTKEISVIGVFNHLEIYNREQYTEKFCGEEFSAENIGATMSEYGL